MFNGDDFPFRAMGAMGQMHRQMMQDMDMMMDGMIGRSMATPFGFGGFPFGIGGGSPFGAITDGTGHQPTRRRQQLEMDPFSGFGGLLGAMNTPMNGGGNMFVSTSMMTIGPDGMPRVEQQTVHKTGDVTETKRRVDKNGESSMSIGHTIGNRSHIIEKKRDKDGNVRRQQNFVNLDEASAEDFDREFASRVRTNFGYSGRSSNRNALEGGATRQDNNNIKYGRTTRRTEAPIITLPEEEEPTTSNRSTSRIGGPVIREISDEEAEQSISKRRRGL